MRSVRAIGAVILAWMPTACSSPIAAPSAAGPAVEVATIVAKPSIAPPSIAMEPQPVYRNPKIGVVYLRAYQDAQGRLMGPQVVYQVTDPGGWNVDAFERGQGCIPSANIDFPPSAGLPYTAPTRPASPVPESPLLDADRAEKITVTGLMREEDRNEAETMAAKAGGGCSALFDHQAGWLLIPENARPATETP
jgi:Type IV conjugative transfer system lipoprotein (TraV)